MSKNKFYFDKILKYVICVKFRHEAKLQAFVTTQCFKRASFWNVNPGRGRNHNPEPDIYFVKIKLLYDVEER